MAESRPSEAPPVSRPALWWLLGINFAVFALWHLWGIDHVETMRDNFLVSGRNIAEGRVWTVLTSAFSHVDAMHLLFNAYALYVFGRPVHDVAGPTRFVALYLAGGITGSIGHVIYGLVTADPVGALGASGAVMAIAMPFAWWFPRVTLILIFVPLPARWAAALFVATDVAGLFGHTPLGALGSNIAHAAHLGGAAVGLLFAWRFRGLHPGDAGDGDHGQ